MLFGGAWLRYCSYEVFDTSHRSCRFRGLVLRGCEVSACVCAHGYILPPCCTCSSVYTCTKRASNFVLQLRRQVLTICKMEGMDGCSSFHGGFLSAWRSQLGRPEYSSSWRREGKDYSLSNTYKRKRANVKNLRI